MNRWGDDDSDSSAGAEADEDERKSERIIPTVQAMDATVIQLSSLSVAAGGDTSSAQNKSNNNNTNNNISKGRPDGGRGGRDGGRRTTPDSRGGDRRGGGGTGSAGGGAGSSASAASAGGGALEKKDMKQGKGKQSQNQQQLRHQKTQIMPDWKAAAKASSTLLNSNNNNNNKSEPLNGSDWMAQRRLKEQQKSLAEKEAREREQQEHHEEMGRRRSSQILALKEAMLKKVETEKQQQVNQLNNQLDGSNSTIQSDDKVFPSEDHPKPLKTTPLSSPLNSPRTNKIRDKFGEVKNSKPSFHFNDLTKVNSVNLQRERSCSSMPTTDIHQQNNNSNSNLSFDGSTENMVSSVSSLNPPPLPRGGLFRSSSLSSTTIGPADARYGGKVDDVVKSNKGIRQYNVRPEDDLTSVSSQGTSSENCYSRFRGNRDGGGGGRHGGGRGSGRTYSTSIAGNGGRDSQSSGPWNRATQPSASRGGFSRSNDHYSSASIVTSGGCGGGGRGGGHNHQRGRGDDSEGHISSIPTPTSFAVTVQTASGTNFEYTIDSKDCQRHAKHRKKTKQSDKDHNDADDSELEEIVVDAKSNSYYEKEEHVSSLAKAATAYSNHSSRSHPHSNVDYNRGGGGRGRGRDGNRNHNIGGSRDGGRGRLLSESNRKKEHSDTNHFTNCEPTISRESDVERDLSREQQHQQQQHQDEQISPQNLPIGKVSSLEAASRIEIDDSRQNMQDQSYGTYSGRGGDRDGFMDRNRKGGNRYGAGRGRRMGSGRHDDNDNRQRSYQHSTEERGTTRGGRARQYGSNYNQEEQGQDDDGSTGHYDNKNKRINSNDSSNDSYPSNNTMSHNTDKNLPLQAQAPQQQQQQHHTKGGRGRGRDSVENSKYKPHATHIEIGKN